VFEEGYVAADVRAYVLIQTAVSASHVAREIRSIEGVESADDVSGPYDVIAVATAGDMDSLGKLVVARIQAVEGITRTLTCPIVQL
jgi:DNA-binding Lrp family transcriptional regulator